jgi:hypothetical protein
VVLDRTREAVIEAWVHYPQLKDFGWHPGLDHGLPRAVEDHAQAGGAAHVVGRDPEIEARRAWHAHGICGFKLDGESCPGLDQASQFDIFDGDTNIPSRNP